MVPHQDPGEKQPAARLLPRGAGKAGLLELHKFDERSRCSSARPSEAPTDTTDSDGPDSVLGLNEDEDVQRWEDEVSQEAGYALEPGLAAYAFVSLLKPRDRLPCSQLHAVAYPWMLLLCTYVIQVAMVYAVQDKVRSANYLKRKQLEDIYSDGLQGVLGVGMPRMSREDAAQVCGSFMFSRYNDSAAFWGQNESEVWTFKYERAPIGDWGDSIKGGERENTLDSTLYVLKSSSLRDVLEVPFSHMFKFVVFIWFCVIAADLSTQLQFLQYLSHARTVQDSGGQLGGLMLSDGCDERLLRREQEGHFEIKGLTVVAKTSGYVLIASEVVLACWALLVGIRFLEGTMTRLDLILNAVALGFVFELDDIVYAAGVSQLQKQFLENLQLAKFTNRQPIRSSAKKRLSKHLGGVLTVLLGAVFAYGSHLRQYNANLEMFNVVAVVCLFLGQSPDDGNAAYDATFPVPGLCESLLELRCEYPPGPCYGTHQDETHCEYYNAAGSGRLHPFTPDETQEHRYCVSRLGGGERGPVSAAAARLRAAQIRGMPGIDLMREVCLAMWQRAPCSEQCGEGLSGRLCQWRLKAARLNQLPPPLANPKLMPKPPEGGEDDSERQCLPAPRRRGTRGAQNAFDYAAPFWCRFKGAASEVLTDGSPQRLDATGILEELRRHCGPTKLRAPPRSRRPFGLWKP